MSKKKEKKGTIKCRVCNQRFELHKENKKVVENVPSLTALRRVTYDAFDCPYCGVQNLTNERLAEKKEEQNETMA